MSKLKVATIIVINSENKVLILRRSKNTTHSGFYNFPGGGIEDNEKPANAATRELFEETELITLPDKIEYIGEEYVRGLNIKTFITDKFIGDVKINRESDEFKWVTVDELRNHLFVGNGVLSKALIEEIEYYIKWRNNGIT